MRGKALLLVLALSASIVLSGCLTKGGDKDADDGEGRPDDDGMDDNETANETRNEGATIHGNVTTFDNETQHPFEVADGHSLLAWQVSVEGSVGGDVEITLQDPGGDATGGGDARNGTVEDPPGGSWAFVVRLSGGLGAAYRIDWCAGDENVRPDAASCALGDDGNLTVLRR